MDSFLGVLLMIISNYSQIFSGFFFNSILYSGLMFLFMLLILSLLVNILVMLSESQLINLFMNFMFLMCVGFFFSDKIFLLFLFLEVVTVAIMMTLLFFGYQIEKISSSWFLLLLGVFTGMLLLYFILLSASWKSFYMICSFLSFLMILFFGISFFMKLPTYFLHIWLPKVHVESPTMGSVLLASLLLKLGGWGIYLFFGFLNFLYIVILMSSLGMIICSFYCMFQSDGKSLIAYSSVVHMSAFLLFLLAFLIVSFFSSFLMLFSHGLVSGILFLYVGYLYSGVLSRQVSSHLGLMAGSLLVGALIMTYYLMNSGLPPTAGFYSEVLGVVSVFITNYIILVLLVVYFMFSFYYSLSYSISMLLGKYSQELFLSMTFLLFLFFSFLGLLVIL